MRHPRPSIAPLIVITALTLAVIAVLGVQAWRFAAAGAAGNQYYVATSGSDSGPGSAAQPFRTIQRAADVAGPGDTINITPGTYAPVTFGRSGSEGNPITVRRNGGGALVWIDAACNEANAVQIKGDYITIQDIGAKRAGEATVSLDAADHVTLERMNIQDWNCWDGEDQYMAGVSSWAGGSHLTVRDSILERRVSVAGDDVGFGNGIWIKNTGPEAGGNHAIEDNTIKGGWDGIGGEPEDVSWGGLNRDSIVQRNNISDCNDDGIQVEGGGQDVTIAYNTVKRCLIGIAFAPALTGPLTIMRNVISEPQPRRGEGPAMFKAGDGSSAEVRVYHNSYFAGAEAADGLKQTNPDMGNIHLLNNAIYASRYAIETYTHTGNMTADYDALASTDRDRLVKWANEWYRPLYAFQGIGQETHGISPASFGWDSALRPQAGSPLIDKGARIPGVNDNYSGSAPDIGAYEFGGANPTQQPSPPPAPTDTPSPRPTTALTPTPTPVATATPKPATPTASPRPSVTPVPVTPSSSVVLPDPTQLGEVRFSGDVDCDGWVSAADGVRLLAIVAGNRDFGPCTHVVDVDCDGSLTAQDALAIVLYVVRTDTRLPVGCALDPAALP